MASINETEIKKIVSRVVEQTLGGKSPAQSQDRLTQTALVNPDPSFGVLPGKNKIAIGSDHGGFELKEILKKHLSENGYELIDCGTEGTSSVDYPDFAAAVAKKVSSGEAWRGVMIDGAGIGSCMAANKIPGIRAAMCYDYATAVNSREHNDANLLTLGAGLIGVNQAKLIVDTWLTTDFGGGRHAHRVDKIMEIENDKLKGGN